MTVLAYRFAISVTLALCFEANTPDGVRRCFMVTVNREGRRPLVARFGAAAKP